MKKRTQKEKEALIDVVRELHTDWRWHVSSPKLLEQPGPERDFYIQFTTLKWDTDKREWKLKCLIETPELIHDVHVKYNDEDNGDEMDVLLQSWKNNWDSFHLTDTRKPKEDEIPLWELYNDFKSHKYSGTVWMR